jgi:microcin C transport system substrate-binding protein
VAIPVQKNMERLGVTMNIRTIDTSQYIARLREGDFDMTSTVYSAHFYPDSSLQIVWQSEFIDSTYNSARVQSEAVDYLVAGILERQEDEKALLPWGRALDRVLTWNHYVIPEWHISKFRVSYWNKFSRPAVRPKYALGFDTWWVDPAKEAKLPRR